MLWDLQLTIIEPSPSRSRSPLPSRQKGRSKSPKRRSVSKGPSGSRSRSGSRSKSLSRKLYPISLTGKILCCRVASRVSEAGEDAYLVIISDELIRVISIMLDFI
ncbi:hypothetical protein V6N13_146803 [Hibiscus sabdariffa]